ncbi:GNAT family N-acetyltransferase [Lysinibacillus sp. NPDC094403]|uniref:GNAT family N-acetyltransferase n=1 Tax=Lysinibacillus sp. NPDC094403 TaxID=3390581 RepID=UPI003D02971F
MGSQGERRFFWLAVEEETKKIIGTIEYGVANELIQKTVKEDITNFPEIGTVFIHPNYQNCGIGSLLLQKIFITLESRNVIGFCLDSGYNQAQTFWRKKLRNPNFSLEHYWNNNSHHMIWKRNFTL